MFLAVAAVSATMLTTESAAAPPPPQPGAINGHVLSKVTGAPATPVGVIVYDSVAHYIASAVTADDGSYTVSGLAAGTYRVCFDANTTPGPRDGYVSGCFHDQTGLGPDEIRQSTPVEVVAGQTTSDVDQALINGGAIRGNLTSWATGTGLPGAYISAYTLSGELMRGTNTRFNTTGYYKLANLPPSSQGYLVCLGSGERGQRFPYGYYGKCYRGVAYNGDPIEPGDLPTGVKPVPVRGNVTTPLDLSLSYAGRAAGRVTYDGAPVHANVVAFDSYGRTARGGSTDGVGDYAVDLLAPHVAYRLCIDLRDQQLPIEGWCYGSATAWDPRSSSPSPDAAAVTVAARKSTPNLDFVLSSS